MQIWSMKTQDARGHRLNLPRVQPIRAWIQCLEWPWVCTLLCHKKSTKYRRQKAQCTDENTEVQRG